MATIKLQLGRGTKDKVNLRVRISDGRDVSLYMNTGIKIDPNIWDSKNETIKKRILINANEKNELLTKIYQIKEYSERAYQKLVDSNDTINSENFAWYYQKELHPQRFYKSDFFILWEEFLQNKENLSLIAQKTLIQCRDSLIRFEKYMQLFKAKSFILSFDTITDKVLQDFYNFIINEYKYLNSPQMENFYKELNIRQWKWQRHLNTANKHLRKFRTFWLWAIKKGYTTKNPFHTYNLPTDRYATPIFLLPEEVKKIYSLDLISNKYLDEAKDIFIFQCMVGCRREDLWTLTKDNIQNGVLVYIPKKTLKEQQKTLRVPLNSIALEILDKYKDNDKPLPLSKSVDYYNRAIRQIAYKAELDRKVTVINTQGEPEIKELKNVLTSHIARKTFISILINNGVAPQVISSMSGHVPNSSAFARYFSIEDEIKSKVVKNLEI